MKQTSTNTTIVNHDHDHDYLTQYQHQRLHKHQFEHIKCTDKRKSHRDASLVKKASLTRVISVTVIVVIVAIINMRSHVAVDVDVNVIKSKRKRLLHPTSSSEVPSLNGRNKRWRPRMFVGECYEYLCACTDVRVRCQFASVLVCN